MKGDSEQKKFLSRGIDYLGDLGAKLRDLRGFSTLAHEMIQNAIDAAGVSRMAFHIYSDALVVDNDGIFSDCGSVDDLECPWREDPNKGHRCDFHRFRYVASGDKRRQEGTVGAFGIGFISVYQITDYPEVISVGRHWILHEEEPENQRIQVCQGCDKCKASGLPGTRFILPWAFDSNSSLRKTLQAECLQKEDVQKLKEDLMSALPTSMLFLRNLNVIELTEQGKVILRLEREMDNNTLLIADGKRDSVWHLLRGNFATHAATLRQKHPMKIEDKRSSEVTLAMSDRLERGIFCAYLPTEQDTNLPIHINADFFTSNDRKRILLGNDFQGEWNRAAIESGTDALSDNMAYLPKLLGHQVFYELIKSVYDAFQQAQKGQLEKSLGQFWEKLHPRLKATACVFSTQGDWRLPTEVLLLEKKEEEKSIPLLEAMEIPVVHSDLRPYYNLLRSKEIGVRLVSIQDIASRLKDSGLGSPTTLDSRPVWLRDRDSLCLLMEELEILLNAQRSQDEQTRSFEAMRACALVPDGFDTLWPCMDICYADEETISLFHLIDPNLPFVADFLDHENMIKRLCDEFSASKAIKCLRSILIDEVNSSEKNPIDSRRLLSWFEMSKNEFLEDEELRSELASIPIFPSASGLRSLTELSLPGDFKDPLGLADIVDIKVLGGKRDFLKELGAEELSLQRYVMNHVPLAFQDSSLSVEKKRDLVGLLSERLGELKGYPETRDVLAGLPIVECDDDSFQKPAKVYLRPEARIILGEDVYVARSKGLNQESIGDLFRWLGIQEKPRIADIVRRVGCLRAETPTYSTIKQVQLIIAHLGERFKEPFFTAELESLQNFAWLPARNDMKRWYRPYEVYADFQAYLFESQALFLDLETKIQRTSVELLKFLGVGDTPKPEQVVNHLLYYVQKGWAVNPAVYRYLNDNARDIALKKLLTEPCLQIDPGKYVRVDQVFWSEHPFGRFRYKLGQDLRMYSNLFTSLGVRDAPDHNDALKVLMEIEEKFGDSNDQLDSEAREVVRRCWQILSQALEDEKITKDKLMSLRDHKVIPDIRDILTRPEWIYFEDRAGLAKRFGSTLRNNVIQRPQGAWRGMEAAGVRTLSDSITSHIIECSYPVQDDHVLEIIKERKSQLTRIFELEKDSRSLDYTLLEKIIFKSVTELKVQYSIRAFERNLISDPESVPAHFDQESLLLYFVKRGGNPPWPAIAREIVLVLLPDEEPGRLASAVKEVLVAKDMGFARDVLDELGFPVIEETKEGIQISTVEIGKLGTSGSDGESPTLPVQEKSTTEERTLGEMTPEEALEKILGPGASPITHIPKEIDKGESPKGTSISPQKAKKSGKQRTNRLRTYVAHDAKDAEESVEVESSGRDPIEQAGVAKVIEYESKIGRFPEEKPHNFPGYDVESKDIDSEIARYIEVKACSDEWDSQGVALSDTQFKKALELGDRYWLYVVDRADTKDFHIFRIQNPANKANQFFFDDGWSVLAEDDDNN